MGKPAARVSDMHVCPKKTGKIPHVGGSIVTGSPDVLIGGLPAARVGDTVACVGPPDKIAAGSSGVLINGTPAARLGDSTVHGGKIVGGCSTVLIGDGGGGQVLDQEAIDVMNAHKAQMRAEVEAAELRAARRRAREEAAATVGGANSNNTAPEDVNVTAADVAPISGISADAFQRAAESGAAFIDIPSDALINDPPLESVPIIPFEAAAQAVVALAERIKTEGLSAGVVIGTAIGSVTHKIEKIIPLDSIKKQIEDASKNIRSLTEALGMAGGRQGLRKEGVETDPNYSDRYHGQDDIGRDQQNKLTETEFKGSNKDSTRLSKNINKENQSSQAKNQRRAKQMTSNKKHKKIDVPSNRQGGTYTQGEIDLYQEIKDLEGDKRHLSTHTNTETGRVRVFERDRDGKNPKILHDFRMENFEEIKNGLEEKFIK